MVKTENIFDKNYKVNDRLTLKSDEKTVILETDQHKSNCESDTSIGHAGIIPTMSKTDNNGGISSTGQSTTTTTTTIQSRYSNSKPQYPFQNSDYYIYDNDSDRLVWEIKKRTPNTTVLNSPDSSNEIHPKLQFQHSHQQIKVGRSPVGIGKHGKIECGMNDDSRSSSTSSPSSPMQPEPIHLSQSLRLNDRSIISEGEVVVFDDIEDNIQIDSIQQSQMTNPNFGPTTNLDDVRKISHITSDNSIYNVETGSKINSKVQRVIGSLPIADYEGSPRRFGNIHHNQAKCFRASPRPGFPQRVTATTDGDDNYIHNKNIIDSSSSTNAVLPTSTYNQSSAVSFDYLYEYSETRKVLDEFFTSPTTTNNSGLDILENTDDALNAGDEDDDDEDDEARVNNLYQKNINNKVVGQRLANKISDEEYLVHSYNRHCNDNYHLKHNIDLYLDDGNSRSSGELADTENDHQMDSKLRNFTLTPETADYESNCGDLDSEVSLKYIESEFGLSNDVANLGISDFPRLYNSMPVLEDGLSSGHNSDNDVNSPNISTLGPACNLKHEEKVYSDFQAQAQQITVKNNYDNNELNDQQQKHYNQPAQEINLSESSKERELLGNNYGYIPSNISATFHGQAQPNSQPCDEAQEDINVNITETLKDVKTILQRNKIVQDKVVLYEIDESSTSSPVWVPRNYHNSRESLDSEQPLNAKILSADEEEADTDLETDRLLGQQRLDETDFNEDKNWPTRKIRTLRSPTVFKSSPLIISKNNTSIRQGIGTTTTSPSQQSLETQLSTKHYSHLSPTQEVHDIKDTSPSSTTNELKKGQAAEKKGKYKSKEGFLEPAVLIEGVLFRARYLGSTQLVCEGQPTKSTRMMQAEEAVSRIKAPDGETQPSTEVDLFISTEKIMVLNTDLKEIMMDHALRTISYIADIGDLVVLMARRRFVSQDNDVNSDGDNKVQGGGTPGGGSGSNATTPTTNKVNRTPKMICHVFESEEAQFIAQSIGQAFQVAYMEFLKANGIEDHSFMKEMDYQEVLNSQEIFGDELEIFAKKELQKEVVVPKAKGEILGVVIVESGWGSMLPTVVIANLASAGAAARCGQLNIGDQIIAINGLSLVGLPLSICQGYIKNTKNQTAVKITVVPCAPVVEVKIKRPNTKYQLGFSVQNGVICSLLRGGIAERGGVRVGHRIIEINNQSVVAVPHEKIVNLLATSVGEILMKTMPTSMFRLLTGQENPIFI